MKSDKPRDIFNLDLRGLRPQLEAEASRQDLSVTQLIRRIIREYFEDGIKPAPVLTRAILRGGEND